VLASPFSRLPVYRESPDVVIGTLRVKDLVERYAGGGSITLVPLVQPVVSLEATLPADRVLTVLRDRRAHSAIVTDPSGKALGLVTIQDVLGELLGPGPESAVRTDRQEDAR
jgi:putative hemolysin